LHSESIFYTFNKIFGSEGMYDEMKVKEIQPNDFYNVGDRICQLVVIPTPVITVKEVEELTETERGEGGFGSTGK
jgi:dUTPase